MNIVDDRNITFAEVQVGQGFTSYGFRIRISSSDDKNVLNPDGTTEHFEDNVPVSDICNVEIHKKRLD